MVITDHINQQSIAGISVSYDETFANKEQLNALLRKEQSYICCYCMQRIDHFHLPPEAGSHNEHLIPQHGKNGDLMLDLEYTNIFACCNYTIGKDFEASYCGHHKGDKLIYPFIRDVNCREYFAYNYNGEILPRGPYMTEIEYVKNRNLLSVAQINALQTIHTLNLNYPPLKELRKRVAASLVNVFSTYDRARAQNKIRVLATSEPLAPFVEMIVYFLNQIK